MEWIPNFHLIRRLQPNYFLAVGCCPKKLAIAEKIIALLDSGGLQPPSASRLVYPYMFMFCKCLLFALQAQGSSNRVFSCELLCYLSFSWFSLLYVDVLFRCSCSTCTVLWKSCLVDFSASNASDSSCLCTSSLKISTLLTCLRFTTLLRFRQWRSEGPGGADSLVCVAVRRDGKNGGGEIYTTLLRRKLTAQKIPKSTNKQQANN